MSSKKIETILNLIEISENNLKAAKNLLAQLTDDKNLRTSSSISITQLRSSLIRNPEEEKALEVVEGHFDGESMIGDNGKLYMVPQNYASKTQLVVGDRMKWILTPEREIFKLIQPVNRERVTGTFAIEGDNFVVLIDKLNNPVKILKASGTYAMKQLGLQVGDEVAIYIPKDATPSWGAFINVVGQSDRLMGKPDEMSHEQKVSAAPEELDNLNEFKLEEFGAEADS